MWLHRLRKIRKWSFWVADFSSASSQDQALCTKTLLVSVLSLPEWNDPLEYFKGPVSPYFCACRSLYFICQQTAWKCSLLLNWWEAPCRSPAFLPSLLDGVSTRAGRMAGASQDTPWFRAGGCAGKDTFCSTPRATRILFRGSILNIQNVVLQDFQQKNNAECRKVTLLASDSYLMVLVHSRKYVAAVIINTRFECFLKAFMSVKTLLFLSIDWLGWSPSFWLELFLRMHLSESRCRCRNHLKDNTLHDPVKSLYNESSWKVLHISWINRINFLSVKEAFVSFVSFLVYHH